MKRIAWLLLLTFFPIIANAQLKYCGKQFFLTLGGQLSDTVVTPGNLYYTSYNTSHIQLASAHHANVQFYYRATGITTSYTVSPYQPLIIDLTINEVNAIVDRSEELVRNQSLEITSDSDITVNYFGGEGGKADDATSILAVDGQQQADSYRLLGVNVYPGDHPTSYTSSIVATCDNVVLEITPRGNTFRHLAGVPYTITLQKGQEYKIGTPSIYGTTPPAFNDISGTLVKVISAPSCFPIEVYNTHDVLYIGWPTTVNGGVCCANITLEQILPENLWDTLYPVAPFFDDSLTILRIMSATNANTIYYNYTPVKTLNEGEVFDTVLYENTPALIRSSKPVGIGQFMVSSSVTGEEANGDPSLLWAYPLKHGIRDAIFKPYYKAISPYNPFREFLTIISQADNTSSIKLNGYGVSAHFHPFPANPHFQFASIQLDVDSTYRLTSDEPVTAYHYEKEWFGSYTFQLSDLSFHYPAGTSYAWDTITKCINGSATLTSAEADSYQWSTGETARSITVSDTGSYTVTGTFAGSCISGMLVHNFYVQQEDSTRTTETVHKCAGVPVLIAAAPSWKYMWSTGDTTQNIDVTSPGKYTVIETIKDSCIHINIRTVHVADKIYPEIKFSNDTTICIGDTIWLHTAYSNTQWSSGRIGEDMPIIHGGVYYAAVTDSCGIPHADTIAVATDSCLHRYCDMVFPSAFTPNNDNLNDRFRPIWYGTFSLYELRIFNRWGTCIYQTNNMYDGWDGIHNGLPCDVGVYMYQCKVTCPAKGNQLIYGDVTLVR